MVKTECDLLEDKLRKKFNKGCTEYSLLADGDRILVALSGGKDSMALVRLLGGRAKIFKPHIQVEAAHVVMDNVPYVSDCDYLSDFCREAGVKFHVLHASFDEATDPRRTKCFLCAWNRRKALFQFATANGFNKVALGHHQDDILVTLLMNMSLEGAISTMPPMLRLEHYPVTIVRPLCLVNESLIAQWAELFPVRRQNASCPYETASLRSDYVRLFREMEGLNPEVRFNLWKSMENIKSDMLPQKLCRNSLKSNKNGAVNKEK